MKPTNTKNPEYYHKVVDCQYACPAHTPVPEYIRLIAAERQSTLRRKRSYKGIPGQYILAKDYPKTCPLSIRQCIAAAS